MKKTNRKLRLHRETLQQLLYPEVAGASPVIGATFPVTACDRFTCPPICTQARPCAG